MSYPEPKAKYPGQDRAAKMCRAEGGGVVTSTKPDIPPLEVSSALTDQERMKAHMRYVPGFREKMGNTPKSQKE